MARIDRRHRRSHRHPGVSQHGAPGVDHQGVAVALAPAVVEARLGGGDHIGRVFDGPGLQQHLPMVLAGKGREGGGHHQHVRPGAGQMAVELREAHVVTDRDADATQARHLHHRRQLAAGLHR